MREEPKEFPETQDEGKCDECGLVFDDLTFVWYGEDGWSQCPTCEGDIWIQAPEPDPDEWRDRLRDAKADRLYDRMYDE